jgi:hypothetical protein
MKITFQPTYQKPVCAGHTNGNLSKRFLSKPIIYTGLLQAWRYCESMALSGSCVTDAATWAGEATTGAQKAAILLYAAFMTLDVNTQKARQFSFRRIQHVYRKSAKLRFYQQFFHSI